MVAKKLMSRSCLNILEHSNNKLPEVIDLFSGCGGLAYGFKASGYTIGHGVEIFEPASKTASYNLYWRYGLDSDHICADITQLSPKDVVTIDDSKEYIVIGGPPCQAYSQIGKAKLRSLGEHRIHTNDARGQLYNDFLRFALELNAKAIVMENVPDATNYGGLNVPQYVCSILEENGYEAYWTILNAADYGVPQIRERVFVLAIHKDSVVEFKLPTPTHRSVDGKLTQNQMKFKKFTDFKNFRIPNSPADNLPAWVTVKEAFSDLPAIFNNSKSNYKLSKVTSYLKYRTEPFSDYQRIMRNWYGQDEQYVSGHSFRNTVRDFPIFERMNQGDDYVNASDIAEQLLLEACSQQGVIIDESNPEYVKLRKKIVPPYDRTKFVSKWKRLNSSLPSHTVVAHLETDTYSHIHPWEPRGITVREAARLQSFPDGFVFQCSMGDAFRQIGNAVPPLLSKAIAETMKTNMTGSRKLDEFATRNQEFVCTSES